MTIKQNKHKPKRSIEFWKRRPLAYYESNKRNKQLCNRIIRHIAKQKIGDIT